MTLRDLEVGKSAVILKVGGQGALRQHFLDMGMIPGAEVTVVKLAPMGDPLELQIHGYELTLRLADAKQIEIEKIKTRVSEKNPEKPDRQTLKAKVEHPRMGEKDYAGSYRNNKIGEPIPKNAPITFALLGNQNCGKTTLFNQLTGSNQHVGNFPGVTVDRKDGVIKNHPEATVTVLPGIY